MSLLFYIYTIVEEMASSLSLSIAAVLLILTVTIGRSMAQSG